MSHLVQPTILLLKDGSETAQGKSHVIHNINACEAIGQIVKTTLGPRGMDKLIYKQGGSVTISNDGRTIIDLLDIVHPAAKTMVDIAIAQDSSVGDGTTTVVILACEFLKQAKSFIEEGVHPRIIISAYRRACQTVVDKLTELQTDRKSNETGFREILERCARTTLQSKLVNTHRDYFAKMCVDAVLSLDQESLNLDLIGIQKIPGGSVTESTFVPGVAFKKTFSYAGFEQQPKKFENPKIVLLNVELELKAEKENAEVRIKDPSEYQLIVNAEWDIIYKKLEQIVESGAQVILSRLPIGDLATQYFADRHLFCAGRVPESDLKRVSAATGAVVQTSLGDLKNPEILGTCGLFEEKQVGSERFNFFTQCDNCKSATIILRGGAQQFIEETHRSLWDALMIVKRCIQHSEVVAGGGAIEMELSRFLRDVSRQRTDKSQLIMSGYAKSLEIIPRQLAQNAGLDATDIVNQLRFQHAQGQRWFGVDIENGSVCNTMDTFVWEPALNKRSALQAATEAACTILSIDQTVKNAKAGEANNNDKAVPIPGHGRSARPSIR